MNPLLTKLTSGRFLLTLAAGAVFVIAATSRLLPPEAISAILVMVIRDYFARNREGEPLK